MSLVELRLENLRCLGAVQLSLHPRFNLVTGANGSGKTSLLEAIYLLGRGRSFRTHRTEQLIRHDSSGLTVFGRIESPDAVIPHTVGVGYSRDHSGVAARIDGGTAASLAQLSTIFPVQVIDPGIHRLVDEGPTLRRRWFDWAVFHVEPTFVGHWQDYQRALRQRNAALLSQADARLWDLELQRLGELLTASRLRLAEAVQPFWQATLKLLDALPVSLGLFQGWSREQTLAAALAANWLRDRERGLTSVGPHRFDVLLRLEGRSVRETVSRGQQKLLGAAMILTMTRYVTQIRGYPPTLLLDDPAAELDQAHTEALLGAVADLKGQLVATTLRTQETPLGVADQVFHVEHGGIERV